MRTQLRFHCQTSQAYHHDRLFYYIIQGSIVRPIDKEALFLADSACIALLAVMEA